MKGFIISIFFFINLINFSQSVLVKGKVTEAESGDPIPFATVYFKNTNVAVQTDFDGTYILQSEVYYDSLVCINDGFITKYKNIEKKDTQIVDFQMYLEAAKLQSVVFTVGEDPAYNLIRKAIKVKDINNKNKLKAYEYDSYTKLELDMDNISNKLRNKKYFKQIGSFMDSAQKVAGEDGKPILPIYISESLSKIYYKNDLPRTTEKIVATKVKGVGIKDGSLVSQLIGSSLVEYNFYNESIFLVDKTIPSPLSSTWRLYYKYFLVDSAFIENEWCYKIEVYPKNKLDLAFKGFMWLADSTWAIKRADFYIGKEANINFLEKIKIQQEYNKIESTYFPVKGRVVVDIAELADSTAGMLAKYYYKFYNIQCNKPREDKFYKNPILVEDDALSHKDEDYWLEHRPDSISSAEKHVYNMIDSLKDVPIVKTYTEIIDIALNGYKKINKIDIGPYLQSFSVNSIEGLRLRLGARTNVDFSRKLVLRGYLAYGFGDQKLKYSGGVKYIFSRKNWTEAEVDYTHDITQLAFMNLPKDELGIFAAFSKWGQQRRASYVSNLDVKFKKDITAGFSVSLGLNTKKVDPLFWFGYYTNPYDTNSTIKQSFVNTESSITLRYAYREILLQNDNERISLGSNKQIPIVSLNVSHGLKNFPTLFGKSDFHYLKGQLKLQQKIKVSFLGVSNIEVAFNKYFNNVPYPLLNIHKGNESFFYRTNAFNLMNFFEFISDKSLTVNYMHYFNGFFMNRIPLFKKLKLREFVGGALLVGTVSDKNKDYIPVAYRTMPDGRAAYQSLGDVPYIEIDYGIENLFKFLRIDLVHRLTYNDVNYKINRFGIRLSGQFKI
ncbi:MAG: DUF5686 family protein [Cytophagales bacterium]